MGTTPPIISTSDEGSGYAPLSTAGVEVNNMNIDTSSSENTEPCHPCYHEVHTWMANFHLTEHLDTLLPLLQAAIYNLEEVKTMLQVLISSASSEAQTAMLECLCEAMSQSQPQPQGLNLIVHLDLTFETLFSKRCSSPTSHTCPWKIEVWLNLVTTTV